MKSYILAVGDAFVDFFNSEDKSFHSFLKSLLSSLLDAVEIAMEAQYIEILGRGLAKLGWAGVADAAAKLALLKAAFAGAKALVKGFFHWWLRPRLWEPELATASRQGFPMARV